MFCSLLYPASCFFSNLWTFFWVRSGNRQLPGSLSVQTVLEANTRTARTGSEEAVMSHMGQEVVKYEREQLFGSQVWLGFKSIITISCCPKQQIVAMEALPVGTASSATSCLSGRQVMRWSFFVGKKNPLFSFDLRKHTINSFSKNPSL